MIHVKEKFTDRVCKELNETGVEATRSLLDKALAAAKVMKRMPAHQRADILAGTSEALVKNAKMLAETIAIEAGKPIKYSR